MRLSLLTVLLLVMASPSGEIYPLMGEPIKGDILSVSDREVVYMQGDKKITRPIQEILKLDFREIGKVPADKAYALVELTDGTQVMAEKVSLKKKEVELSLLTGPVMKLPVGLVANVLMDAGKDAHRKDWKTRVFNMRGKEAIVVKRDETISSIDCVLGEGDDTGTAISVAVTIDDKTDTYTRKLSSLHGIIFKNVLGPKATPMVCKLFGTQHDVIMVSNVTTGADGMTVTTPAGAQITFKTEQIARMDYTPGKLDYLSDLEPTKIVVRSNLDEDIDKPDQWHIYKDLNLEKKPMVLGGVTYAKGLAFKPFAELSFDLKGEYRALEAIVGIDDGISAAGGTKLIIEGDGKEMMTLTINSEDKVRHKKLDLNVKDVQKLKITVKSEDDFDTARHLNLADAKVRKE